MIISLSSKVIVSDPCYTLPTWCQARINNVLPGDYKTDVFTTDETNGWGERCSHMVAIHEDYLNKKDFIWEDSNEDIGVDSGQAGIFCSSIYPEGESTGEYGNLKTFYGQCCDLTRTSKSCGIIKNRGVVSSSGFGDGSYKLYLAKESNGYVIGFVVDFQVLNIPIDLIVEEFVNEHNISIN